ncbi:MAG: Transcriptional regulator, MerR family, partial [uncultured Friedmanniella sp.]
GVGEIWGRGHGRGTRGLRHLDHRGARGHGRAEPAALRASRPAHPGADGGRHPPLQPRRRHPARPDHRPAGPRPQPGGRGHGARPGGRPRRGPARRRRAGTAAEL